VLSAKNHSITVCRPPDIQGALRDPEFQAVPREKLSECSTIRGELTWRNHEIVGEEERWGECFPESYLTM
jgi:hypothetical protein